MPGSIKGHMLLQRYQNMVDKLFCQPKEEAIMGSFIEKNIGNIEPVTAKKRKTVKKAENPKGCKDIPNFFQKRRRNNKDGDDADETPVTICIGREFLLNLCTFYLHLYIFFYLLETFLQFHNTHYYFNSCLKNEGSKKAKKKNFARIYFREFTISKVFTRIYFRESTVIKYFVRI